VEPIVNDDRDIGRYLGLVGPWAWLLFGFYVLVFTTIALLGGAPTAGLPVTLASLVSVIVAALLVTSPAPTPLPVGRLVLIAVAAVGSVVIMTLTLPHGLPGELVVWQLSAVNFVLFVVELRGRIASAWGILVVVAAIMIGWSLITTGSPANGVRLTYGQAIALVAGTIFAIGLWRTTRLIFAQQDAERARAGQEAARHAGDAQRTAELAHIRALAEPTLRAIAAGTADDRRAALNLEAALRDRIRGRALAIEPLAEILRRRRAEGDDILLLDDTDEALPDEIASAAAAWCAERLEETRGGRMTVRVAPGGEGWTVSIADDATVVAERVWSAEESATASRP
jgi:hypothetical protein